MTAKSVVGSRVLILVLPAVDGMLEGKRGKGVSGSRLNAGGRSLCGHRANLGGSHLNRGPAGLFSLAFRAYIRRCRGNPVYGDKRTS